jgi:hypothetical protein
MDEENSASMLDNLPVHEKSELTGKGKLNGRKLEEVDSRRLRRFLFDLLANQP